MKRETKWFAFGVVCLFSFLMLVVFTLRMTDEVKWANDLKRETKEFCSQQWNKPKFCLK